MSAIRRVITAGTLVAPMVLFLAGTATATSRSDQGYPPNHPVDGDIEFGESVPFIGLDGTGIHQIFTGVDEEETWYFGEGAFADSHGAGTYELSAGTEDDETWFSGGGTFANSDGAGTVDVAGGTDDDGEAYFSGEGTFAGIDGAGVHGVNSGTEDGDAWYFSDGAYAHEDAAGTYDQGAWTHDGEAGYFDHGTWSDSETSGTYADGSWTDGDEIVSYSDGIVAPSHDSELLGSDLTDDHHVVTNLVKEPAAATAPAETTHGCGCDHPEWNVRPIVATHVDDWAGYHQVNAASGPHGSAMFHEAGFTADDLFMHYQEGAAAGPEGAAYHEALFTGGDD